MEPLADVTAQSGLGSGETSAKDLALGDFDDDGDIDMFTVRADGKNVLYSNLRQGKFEDATSKAGIQPLSSSGAVAVGDYNNDGYLDLFITSTDGSGYRLYKNNSDGTFEEDKASSGGFEALKSLKGHDALFLDFDNDGHLDILVIGEPLKLVPKASCYFTMTVGAIFERSNRLLPQEITGGTQSYCGRL